MKHILCPLKNKSVCVTNLSKSLTNLTIPALLLHDTSGPKSCPEGNILHEHASVNDILTTLAPKFWFFLLRNKNNHRWITVDGQVLMQYYRYQVQLSEPSLIWTSLWKLEVLHLQITVTSDTWAQPINVTDLLVGCKIKHWLEESRHHPWNWMKDRQIADNTHTHMGFHSYTMSSLLSIPHKTAHSLEVGSPKPVRNKHESDYVWQGLQQKILFP